MNRQITFLFMRQQPVVGRGLLIIEASRSHTHKHSVALLWTSDQLVSQNSTSQHTIRTTDRHPCPSGIRTRNPSKLEAADPRLSPRALGLWATEYSVDGSYARWQWSLRSSQEVKGYLCFGRHCSPVICRWYLTSCLLRNFKIHGVNIQRICFFMLFL